MSEISAELDASAMPTPDLLKGVLQRHINEASHVTADAVVREGQARLKRQLSGSSTGATVEGINTQQAYDNNGFIVQSEREPFPNLPLWLEKGTKKGKAGSHTELAKPFFYVSILLESQAHKDRIADALQAGFDETGLGQ